MSTEKINGSAPKDDNWHKEAWLSKSTVKEHLDKREILQKEDLLQQNLMKAVNLSATPDGYLHFGDVVMLVNAGGEQRECSAVCIKADIGGLEMSPSPGIKSPCELSAGIQTQPCTRNAFIIASVDGSPERSTLLFEQSFALKTTSGFARGLYLTSDPQTPQKKSRMQAVNLVDEVSFLSWWKILHFDPGERLEYEGQPVPASQKIVLKHYKTNQALAVLGDHILDTAYGKDYELAVCTFLDADKVDSNHWTLRTYKPASTEVEPVEVPEASDDHTEPK